MKGPISADRVTAAGYLSIPELAMYAGLSERTLRGYLSHPANALPSYRIGGRVLVRKTDYDAWAAQFRIVPESRVGAIVDDIMRGL